MADKNQQPEEDDFGDFLVNQSENDLNKAVVEDDEFSGFKEHDEPGESEKKTNAPSEFQRNYDILNDLKTDSFVQKNPDLVTPTEPFMESMSRQGGAKELIDLLSNYEKQGENSRVGMMNDDSYRDIATQSFLETLSPGFPESKFKEKHDLSNQHIEGEKSASKIKTEDEDLFDNFQEEPSGREIKDSLKDPYQEINLIDISAISKGDFSRIGHGKKQSMGVDVLLNIVDNDVSLPNVADITAPGPLDKDIEEKIMEDSVVKPSSKIAEEDEFGEEQEEARIEENSTSQILKDFGTTSIPEFPTQGNILNIDYSESWGPSQQNSHLNRPKDGAVDSPVAVSKEGNSQSFDLLTQEFSNIEMKKITKDQPVSISIDLNQISLDGPLVENEIKMPSSEIMKENEDDLFEEFKEEQPNPQEVISPVIKERTPKRKEEPEQNDPAHPFGLITTETKPYAELSAPRDGSRDLSTSQDQKHGPPHDPAHPIESHINPKEEENLFGDEIEPKLPGGVDEEDDLFMGVDPNLPHHLPVPDDAETSPQAIDIVTDEIKVEPGDLINNYQSEEVHANHHEITKEKNEVHSDPDHGPAPAISKKIESPKDDDEDLFDDFEENDKIESSPKTEEVDEQKLNEDSEKKSVQEAPHEDANKQPSSQKKREDDEEEDLFGDEQEFEDSEPKESKPIEQYQKENEVKHTFAQSVTRPQLMFDANQFDILRENLQGISTKKLHISKPQSKSKKIQREQAKLSTCKVMNGQPIPVEEHYQALNRILSEIGNPGYQLTTEDKLNYSLHRKLMLTYWQNSVFNESEYLESIDRPTAMLKDFSLGDINEINKRIVAEKWKRMSEEYLKSLPDYSSIFA